MSLLITGNKSKINISQIEGLPSDLENIINQNTDLTQINNNITQINNSIALLQNNSNSFDNSTNETNILNLQTNKLDISTFNTEKTNINNSIALKSNITDLNNGLSLKLNITDFNTEKTTLNNSINLKWNITDVNNWLNNKLNITDFNTEKTTLNNSINLKWNISDVNTSLNNKLNITDFNTEKTTLNNSIALKSNITDLNNGLALKLNITDFNTEKTNINNSIALKSNITDVNTSLNNKLNITDFNTEKNNIYNSLNTKAQIVTTYTKSETDIMLNTRMPWSQNAIINDSINYKLNTSTYNNDKIILDSQIWNINTSITDINTAITNINSNGFDNSTNEANILNLQTNKLDIWTYETEKTTLNNAINTKLNIWTFNTEKTAIDLTLYHFQINKLNITDFNTEKTEIYTLLNDKINTTLFNSDMIAWQNIFNTSLNWKANTVEVYNKYQIDSFLIDKVDRWFYNLDKWNIETFLNNLQTLKSDITYVDNQLLLKANIIYVDDEIINMSNTILSLINADLFNINNSLNDLNTYKNASEVSTNLTDSRIVNLENLTNNLGTNITFLETYNTTNNNIELNRLYKTGALLNQIIKFDGTNVIWSDNAAGGGGVTDLDLLTKKSNQILYFTNTTASHNILYLSNEDTTSNGWISIQLSKPNVLNKFFKIAYDIASDYFLFSTYSYYLICQTTNSGTISINTQRLINDASTRISYINTPNNGYVLKEHIWDSSFIANDSITSVKLKKESVFTINVDSSLSYSYLKINNMATMNINSGSGLRIGTNSNWSKYVDFRYNYNNATNWTGALNIFVDWVQILKLGAFDDSSTTQKQLIFYAPFKKVELSDISSYPSDVSQLTTGSFLLKHNINSTMMNYLSNGTIPLTKLSISGAYTNAVIKYSGSSIQWLDDNTTVSTRLVKHNILNKKIDDDILTRILKLNVKTYGYIYNDENGNIKFDNKYNMGLIIEEIYNIFPKMIWGLTCYLNKDLTYENIENIDFSNNDINFSDLTTDEIKKLGIKYNYLTLYLLLAFQQAYKKQHDFNEKIIQNLKDIDGQILNLVKMKKSESYSNILNNSYDSAIWDLIKNNELLNKKNELLKNQLNTLEIKYNWMENQYNNMAKSYDELFIEIKHLKDSLNNKQDIQKTSSLFKKSTTLKK